MSEQKHTGGEWDYFVGNANGRGLIRIEQHGTGKIISTMVRGEISEANARRIVACVNALEGMDTEMLETLKSNLKMFVDDAYARNNERYALQDKVEELTAQRDELLAGLRECKHYSSTYSHVCEIADALIAKIEQEMKT